MIIQLVSSSNRARLRFLLPCLLVALAACGGGDAEEAAPTESQTRAMPLPASVSPDTLPVTAVQDTVPEPPPTPEPEPAAQPARKPAPPVAEGNYALQLGSYGSAGNADDQLRRVVDLGYHPVIETVTVDGQAIHRVMLRGLPDRAEAERIGEAIRLQLGTDYLIRRRD